jgi:DNA-binding MarR family transcriptional regulator
MTSAEPADPAAPSHDLDAALYQQPGHLIRRAQQIAVAMFVDALGRDVTPVQYAVLCMLQARPGIDQVTLAREVALDTSTTADIAARLETKGWLHREVLPRRQRALRLTAEGEAVLAALRPGLQQMNEAMLHRLEDAERAEFMRLLRKFVQLNNAESRAPLRSDSGRI